MSKTPTKNVDSLNYFIPKEITTPNKDSPGISKTVYTHISNVHNLLGDWVRIRDKGVKLCKSITALKLHECEDDYYPHQMKTLIEALMEACESLEHVVEGVKIINNQMQALAKLQPCNEAVIYTWPAKEIAATVSNITDNLQKELRLKQVITENVAHCRDENLIEVYVSAWEVEVYFTMDSSTYLFAEVGITGVT